MDNHIANSQELTQTGHSLCLICKDIMTLPPIETIQNLVNTPETYPLSFLFHLAEFLNQQNLLICEEGMEELEDAIEEHLGASQGLIIGDMGGEDESRNRKYLPRELLSEYILELGTVGVGFEYIATYLKSLRHSPSSQELISHIIFHYYYNPEQNKNELIQFTEIGDPHWLEGIRIKLHITMGMEALNHSPPNYELAILHFSQELHTHPDNTRANYTKLYSLSLQFLDIVYAQGIHVLSSIVRLDAIRGAAHIIPYFGFLLKYYGMYADLHARKAWAAYNKLKELIFEKVSGIRFIGHVMITALPLFYCMYILYIYIYILVACDDKIKISIPEISMFIVALNLFRIRRSKFII